MNSAITFIWVISIERLFIYSDRIWWLCYSWWIYDNTGNLLCLLPQKTIWWIVRDSFYAFLFISSIANYLPPYMKCFQTLYSAIPVFSPSNDSIQLHLVNSTWSATRNWSTDSNISRAYHSFSPCESNVRTDCQKTIGGYSSISIEKYLLSGSR